jgi:hypothetical protein
MFEILLLLLPLDAMGKPGLLLLLLPVLAIFGIFLTVHLFRQRSRKRGRETAI